jgi:energy-coupling factor transport system substrate-specific component
MSTTSNSKSVAGSTESPAPAPARHWRTVDAVVAAVLGVAFGVVFAGWNALWNALQPAFVGFPPAQGVMYGLWMLPGVLGMLVIRKPGAALFTELVASLVSMLFGGWGLTILIWGFFEGLLPELVFAAFAYRRFATNIAALAGASAGLIAAILDTVYYYPQWAVGWKLVYGVLLVVSSAVIGGLGGVALVKSLRRTGVLSPFASGRG